MKKVLAGILLCTAAFVCFPFTVNGADNFAVIWHWQTQDEGLVQDNLPTQFDQLKGFVNKGIIESVYYDPEPDLDVLAYFPGVSFCIQADSIQGARKLLDSMVFVREDIATYTLFPVGTKWLGRNPKATAAGKINNAYVTIWTTTVDPASKAHEKYVAEQTSALTNLWNAGVVENAYFDVKGLKDTNDITDFVFYVNAASEKEAREIIHELPFYREGIARYNLYPVGMPWLSKTAKD